MGMFMIKWNANLSGKKKMGILPSCNVELVELYVMSGVKARRKLHKILRAVLNICWKQHSTKTSCTAIYFPSHNLSNQDKQDMLDTVGEERTYLEAMIF